MTGARFGLSPIFDPAMSEESSAFKTTSIFRSNSSEIKNAGQSRTGWRVARHGKIPLQSQGVSASPAPSAKIFLFSFDPNQMRIHRHPAPVGGALAIVTNVGRGERWTRSRTG